jgi:hypothetical protein
MLLRRSVLIGGLAGTGLVLAGCATMRTLTTQVSSYGSWPASRKPATYAFDRLPSQMAQAMEQDRIEAAAVPSLEAAGFKQAPRDQADVLVQVAAHVVETNERWRDPFYWRADWWYYRRHPFFHPGFGMYYDAPEYQREVGVLIRDRRSNEALYETHARYSSTWTSDAILPAMFEAALKDFPQPAVSPRQVVVSLQPKS